MKIILSPDAAAHEALHTALCISEERKNEIHFLCLEAIYATNSILSKAIAYGAERMNSINELAYMSTVLKESHEMISPMPQYVKDVMLELISEGFSVQQIITEPAVIQAAQVRFLAAQAASAEPACMCAECQAIRADAGIELSPEPKAKGEGRRSFFN
jgi:hypothetical protein